MKDIVERYKLKDDVVLSALVDALSSSIGSLTNPHKLACTAASLLDKSTSDHTIKTISTIWKMPFFLTVQKDITSKEGSISIPSRSTMQLILD